MSATSETTIDFSEVQDELRKVEEKEQRKLKEKSKRKQKKQEIKEKRIDEGNMVQIPTKQGNIFIEKWKVWVLVALFIFVLLFGVLTVVFGYSAMKDKFKTTIDQPINSICNISCPSIPVCPACPGLDCGNQTVNITLNPTFDIKLNSS